MEPTYFPNLPPLPDPADPVKRITEGLNQLVDQLREADAARKSLMDAGDKLRESVEGALKRGPT